MKSPSKKVLSLFVLVVAFVASAIIIFGKDKEEIVLGNTINLRVGDKIVTSTNSNWQKDFDQITTHWDQSQIEDVSETELAQNTTDTASINLVSNYLALKENNLLNQSSAERLVTQTNDYIFSKSGFVKITSSNLNVVPSNSSQNIYEYGENLGRILRANRPAEFKNEVLILQEIIEGQDVEKMAELQAITSIYQNMANEMQKMIVPYIFTKSHVDMVNGALGIAHGLEILANVFDDPLKSLQGTQTYTENGDLFTTALYATTEFIKKNNIEYKQGSGGYYLLYGI